MKINKPGYALLEMLTYAAILITTVNVFMGIMVASSRLNATATATLDRTRIAADIREQFSRDVREAKAVCESVASYKTSSDQLVLELPDQPGQRRYVVYGALKSPTALDRLEFTEKDGEYTTLRHVTFPLALEAMNVDCQPASSRLVSLEIAADVVGNRPLPKGVRRKPPVEYHFAAAMRSVGAVS